MPRPDKAWRDRTTGILKAELARRRISYKELAERLTALGIPDNERNIANKLSRGTFTAVWFIQVMDVIGVKTIRLDPED